MDRQRLRNLTTGRLHTKIKDVYEDLEHVTGMQGFMTHMLPNALDAALLWLRDNVRDERLWDGIYDPTDVGNYDLPAPTTVAQVEIQTRYRSLPSPLTKIGAANDAI